MIISESVVDIPTSSGPMRLHVFAPTVITTTHKTAKLCGVAVFTEIYQVTGPVERFCRQIAGNGYIVACPESYHEFEVPGTVLAYDVEGTDRGNRYKIEKELRAYDEDATLTLDFLAAHPNCNGRLGATGMCLGGHLGKNKSDDSLVRSKEIRGETVMIFGKFDNHVPAAGRQLIYKTLLENKVDFGWVELPAQHAFIRDELSKGRYDPPLTKICFERKEQRNPVMAWDDLVPSEPALYNTHILYLALGAFITIFGLISLIIKDKLFMSEAMVAVVIGVLVGPVVSNIFDASTAFGEKGNIVTLEFTRFIIAIQCMACGVDLPGSYIQREWVSLAILCLPIMAIKWVVSALGIYLIMGLPFLDCLVISACITPTDPVLANSIVKGKFAEKYVPLNVRLILSAESGANDGLGTPFLLLAIYLQRLPVGQAIGSWAWKVVLYQVVLSAVVGALIAYIAKRLLKTAERRDWMDKESILSFSIALTVRRFYVDFQRSNKSEYEQLLIMGVFSLIGSDDIFATFIAGNILTWDQWFNAKVVHSSFQEVIDALLNLTFFVYIGSLMPWSSFNSGVDGLDIWRLVLVALWILILRRVPVVMAFSRWIPALKDNKEAFFAGWFGPIGAGAIFYAHIAVVYFGYPASPILPVVFFVVLASVLVHGGSVALFNMSLSRTTTYTVWDMQRRRLGLSTIAGTMSGILTSGSPKANPLSVDDVVIVRGPDMVAVEVEVDVDGVKLDDGDGDGLAARRVMFATSDREPVNSMGETKEAIVQGSEVEVVATAEEDKAETTEEFVVADAHKADDCPPQGDAEFEATAQKTEEHVAQEDASAMADVQKSEEEGDAGNACAPGSAVREENAEAE
ncbi:hypothetical protein HDU84_006651 [Entophlyctis sp. JEL0112]|nr:hypothetical protein HDU84_006651 [Entophlyctis sp. JEL0112]